MASLGPGAFSVWVASNDVEKTVDWFHRHSKAHFLGLFVAGDKKFAKLLKEVISERQTIDILSGKAIDLVLFSATPIEEDPQSGSLIQRITKLQKWSPSRGSEIANATAMSTNDIAEALHLTVDQLPGLVLIRRRIPGGVSGDNRLVLRLRGADDVDFIIEFLRAFRASIERFSLEQSLAIPNGMARLTDMESRLERIPDERAVIEKRARTLSRDSREISSTLMLPAPKHDQLFDLLKNADLDKDVWNDIASLAGVSIDELHASLPAELIRRCNKARVARRNAFGQIAKLETGLPASIEYVNALEVETEALDRLVRSFERKNAIEGGWAKMLIFLKLAEGTLARVKRLAKLVVAIKTIV